MAKRNWVVPSKDDPRYMVDPMAPENFLQDKVESAFTVIVSVMEDPEARPDLRFKAATEVIDRVYGKSASKLDMNANVNTTDVPSDLADSLGELDDEELEVLSKVLRSMKAKTVVVDG